MEPTHITLEPNEANTDSAAVTLYFPKGATPDIAKRWVQTHGYKAWAIKSGNPTLPKELRLNLWVDVEDKFFNVIRTEKQPLPDQVRFQAHPTC